MSKWSIMGLLLCGSGLLMLGFQVISRLVGQEDDWQSLSVYDLSDPEKLEWIEKLTWFGIDRAVDFVFSAPLYLLLLIVGGICLIISGFIKN